MAPLFWRHHLRQHRLGRAVDRADIEIDGAGELRLGQLHRAAHMGEADIVVQDVDAVEAREHPRHGGLDGSKVGDVGGTASAVPPSPVMMPAVSAAAASSRSMPATRAPSRAKATAAALPLPQPGPDDPAPKTMAAFPFKRSTMATPC